MDIINPTDIKHFQLISWQQKQIESQQKVIKHLKKKIQEPKNSEVKVMPSVGSGTITEVINDVKSDSDSGIINSASTDSISSIKSPYFFENQHKTNTRKKSYSLAPLQRSVSDVSHLTISHNNEELHEVKVKPSLCSKTINKVITGEKSGADSAIVIIDSMSSLKSSNFFERENETNQSKEICSLPPCKEVCLMFPISLLLITMTE